MGIFKRSSESRSESGGGSGSGSEPVAGSTGSVDLSAMLMQGQDMIEQLGAAHSQTWGLGTAERWDLDQTSGLITWTFPDKTATAPAQILGSYNADAGSWLWAWANSSILPELGRDAATVRDWALDHGVEALTIPKVDCDPDQADSMIALAVRVTEATGFYKGGSAGAVPIITFGPVTLTFADGTTRTVAIELGD